MTALPASPLETDDLPSLIDDICERFHEVHRADLAWLIAQAEALAAEGVAVDLPDALRAVADALEAHMFKEEMRLFPMMLQGGNRLTAHLMAELKVEHQDHPRDVAALATRLDAHALDAAAAPSSDTRAALRALRARYAKFEEDLRQHVHAEDAVLFPRFDGPAPRF